jgi:hypothetical protein
MPLHLEPTSTSQPFKFFASHNLFPLPVLAHRQTSSKTLSVRSLSPLPLLLLKFSSPYSRPLLPTQPSEGGPRHLCLASARAQLPRGIETRPCFGEHPAPAIVPPSSKVLEVRSACQHQEEHSPIFSAQARLSTQLFVRAGHRGQLHR